MIRMIAPARSLGLKLVLVGALAFLLWIPCLMIYALVWERSSRAEAVRSEIFELAGGRQSISGPVILVPTIVDTGRKNITGDPVTRRATAVFTPKTLDIGATLETSVRKRSIYDATVYDADIEFAGRFAPLAGKAESAGAATYLWNEAKIALRFSGETSLKGIRDAPLLTIDGKTVAVDFEPGVAIEAESENVYAGASGVSAPLPIAEPAKGFDYSIRLRISGGGGLSFSPVGQETFVRVSADWPHPSFQGARMPDKRAVSAAGFAAEWRAPYLARSLAKSFLADPGLASLENGKAFGVDLVSTTGPYQNVNRALKYALMFLGIVFLTFFLIEATMGGRAHAAQYILLGLAQVVFYLLVLSFAEHIGFETAFIGASAATVTLSGLYAATVFHSLLRGIIAFLAFSGAYSLIYLLMKSEDYALLIGSVAAFGAVALTMAVTRNLDWYGAQEKAAGAQ